MSLFSDVFKREEEAGAAREAAKASRKELQRQLDAAKEQNAALTKRAEDAEANLEAVRSALEDVDNQIDEVKTQNEALVKRAEDAEKETSELQRQLDAAKEQIKAMTEKAEASEKKAEELQEELDAAAEGLKAFDRLKALLLMTDAERVEHFHTLELWAKEDDRIAGERSDYKKAFEEREHIRDTYMGVLDVTEIIALEK